MVSIPRLSLGTEKGYEETLEFQRTYKSVLKTIQKVCQATGLGFRIRPDFATRDLYFEVLKGIVTPHDCPLFGKACVPTHAIGPCMVSVEGVCAAWYKYGKGIFSYGNQ